MRVYSVLLKRATKWEEEEEEYRKTIIKKTANTNKLRLFIIKRVIQTENDFDKTKISGFGFLSLYTSELKR